MKVLLSLLLIIVSSSTVNADEYLIFKRLADDLGPADLPHHYTVWNIDALKLVSAPIEAEVSQLTDPQQAFDRAQALLKTHGDQKLMTLFLMSYAAREKMHRYGLTQTPSAVLLNEAGQVISTWKKVARATDLLRKESE